MQVQLKCLETVRKIFTHKDKSISHSYIHSLAPGVISLLNTEIDSSLLNKLTKAKYRLIVNGLEIVRLLVELAEKSKFGDRFSPSLSSSNKRPSNRI